MFPQEMFGCQDTPTIADGMQALIGGRLAPARRPLQVTQDLAGFWRGSYQDVKKEMKGRYPKLFHNIDIDMQSHSMRALTKNKNERDLKGERKRKKSDK